MKIKSLAVISPLILLTCLSNAKGVISGDTLVYIIESSPTLGPYDGSEGTQTLNYVYTYKGSSKKSNMYEALSVRDASDRIVQTSKTTFHSLTQNQTYRVALNFNASLLKTNSQITLNFKIFDKLNIVKNITLTINRPCAGQEFDIEKTTSMASNSLAINFKEEKEYAEEYNFSHMEPYFNNDSYYDLRIDNQEYYYSFGEQEFDMKSGYLLFEDPDNLFPYIPFIDLNVKGIPIYSKLVDEEANIYSFRFPNTMYFEPNTLNMSLTYKTGFVATNHFFLPLKKQKDIEGMRFTLKLEEAGVEKNTFYYQMYYYSNYAFFGDCGSSDNCIEGEIN